jgi:integrase
MYQRSENWYSDFWFQGQRYTKSWGAITKTVAKEKDRKFRTEVKEGKHSQKSKLILFEIFKEKYLEHARVNKKPKSATRNEVSIKMLMPHFKGKLISSIHPFQVEQYKKDRLDKGTSPATVNRDVACFRNMMNMAVQWGYLQVNPIAKVKQLQEDNERMWVLSGDEERRFLAECDKRPQKLKYLRDLAEVALHSGMRQDEIFGLKWVNVHLNEKYLVATDTKTHVDRAIPMNFTLEKILRRRNVTELGDYVFTNAAGERLTGLTNAYWRAVKEAGLVRWEEKKARDRKTVKIKIRFRFHDLRHTFGSRLGMNGADLKTIMKIMGHKTPKTAMRYQHPSPEHKLTVVRSLDRLDQKNELQEGKIIRLKMA